MLLLLLVSAPALANVITISQKNKSFTMGTQIVRTIEINKGDTIKFENEDPFFHNVFSFSNIKTFDLGSYKAGTSKSVTFDKEGRLAVECAIHPRMILNVNVK